MKKYILLILALSYTFVNYAQKYEWAAASVGGGTNVFKCFAVDNENNIVVMGSSTDYSSPYTNRFAITKHNKLDGKYIYRKNVNGVTLSSDGYKIFTDEANNYYYVGTVKGSIFFKKDTVVTQPFVELLFAKFNSEGENIWAKTLKVRNADIGIGSIFGVNKLNDKFITYVSIIQGDSLFFGGDFKQKLNYAGSNKTNYYKLSIDTAGSFLDFNFLLNEQRVSTTFSTEAGEEDLITAHLQYQTANQFYLKTNYYTNSNNSFKRDSALITALDNNYSFILFDFVATSNARYFAIGSNTTNGILNNIDSVTPLPQHYNLRYGVIVKTDTMMNVLKTYRFQWYPDYPSIRWIDNKLVLTTKFSNVLYLEGNDSIYNKTNQYSWCNVVLDENLVLKDTFQINTNNASSYKYPIHQMHADADGNIYSIITHGKDIIFGDTSIKAANKSWEHLTAICKRGYGTSSTSVRKLINNSLPALYPNPTSGVLYFDNNAANSVVVNDITGKQVGTFAINQNAINISHLPEGIYFVTLFSKDQTRLGSTKIIKQ